MGAERSQWQFPANEVGKVIGWSDEASPSNPNASKGLVNKGPFVEPGDIANMVETTDTDASGFAFVIDDDTMATASDETLSTSESMKAYADTKLGLAASANGSFWPDEGAEDAKIFRGVDRLFLSDGALYDGTWAVASSTGLTDECRILHGWGPREAALFVDHRYGTMAIVGHAQSSKGVDNSWPGIGVGAIPGPIGVSGFAIGDVTNCAAWGVYADAKRLAGAGFTVGLEVSIANFDVTPGVITPYNAKAGGASSVGIWLQSGGGMDSVGYADQYGAVGHAAVAMAIVSSFANDSKKFVKGIVFDDGALLDLSGGSNVYEAITLPQNTQISWYRASDGAQSGFIWAVPTTGPAIGLTFKTGLVEVSGAGLANIVSIAPAATGQSPYIAVGGTDANIPFTIYSKGTGSILFNVNGALQATINQFAFNIEAGKVFAVNNLPVVTARKTGWAVATGTATRTTFATGSVTLPQLAERVKALIDDLHAAAGHGLIGT